VRLVYPFGLKPDEFIQQKIGSVVTRLAGVPIGYVSALYQLTRKKLFLPQYALS
jgi:hypothetical protein